MKLSEHDREIREIRKILRQIVQERAEESAAREKEREKYAAARAEEAVVREKEREKDAAELQKWRKEFGSYTDAESECLEDEFYDALLAARKIDGARLDEIHLRAAGGHDDMRGEYDIVALNGKSVFVAEIKHSLTAKKVREFAQTELPRFAEIFPVMARRRKVRGMVGGARITEAAAKEARRQGLYLLRLQNNRKLAVESPERA